MSHMSVCPLHALRACSGLLFWPLEQRIAAKAASRRWREAAVDPELWAELDVPPSLAAALPALLRQHGECLRSLTVAAQPSCPPEQRFVGLLASLTSYGRLLHLSLRGLSGPELARGAPEAVVPSLQTLSLSYVPYFILSNYNHHTGIPAATMPIDWLAKAFPQLKELTCDYLQLDKGPPVLPSLRKLSLVAMVRNIEVHVLWGSPGCNRDLTLVAQVAPHLEQLEWRDPRPNLGRMSWRASQSVADLCWLCRRFCALDPEQLAGARSFLPRLSRLEVATLKESTDLSLESCNLASFLGLERPGGQGGSASAGSSSLSCSHVAPLQLHFGGLSQEVAEQWHMATSRSSPALRLETASPPPQGRNPPRTLVRTVAEAALQFPAALWNSDDEGSSTVERPYAGSFLGSPLASSVDSWQDVEACPDEEAQDAAQAAEPAVPEDGAAELPDDSPAVAAEQGVGSVTGS